MGKGPEVGGKSVIGSVSTGTSAAVAGAPSTGAAARPATPAAAPLSRITGLPQLDDGTFAGRQCDDAMKPPQIWSWCVRGGPTGGFEYWMQLLPGHEPAAMPYVPCSAASPREFLRMDQTQLTDPQAQPMNDARQAADRDAFHRAVLQCYPQALGLTVNSFRRFLAFDATTGPLPPAAAPAPPNSLLDPGANGVERVLGDGLYAMYQITNPEVQTLPLGWAWIPPSSGARQVWAMIAPMQNVPFWRRPSAATVPLSRLWIEYVEPSPQWDLVNNANASIILFESWIRTHWPHAATVALDIQFMRAADVT